MAGTAAAPRRGGLWSGSLTDGRERKKGGPGAPGAKRRLRQPEDEEGEDEDPWWDDELLPLGVNAE